MFQSNLDIFFTLDTSGKAFTRLILYIEELRDAIRQIDLLKIGFDFDNQLAIETLTRFIEESR
jgi:hypothetical protein